MRRVAAATRSSLPLPASPSNARPFLIQCMPPSTSPEAASDSPYRLIAKPRSAASASLLSDALRHAMTPVAELRYKAGLKRVLENVEGAEQENLRLAQELVELGQKVLGPRHPDSVTLRAGLAVALWHAGDDARAAPTARSALQDATA